MDSVNILTGLNIPAQIPLDVKLFSISEEELSDLGLNNNKAFTYYKDMFIYCLNERKTYQWREVLVGEENSGLLTNDFIYPNNLTVFGVNYSNKRYNFFEVIPITSDNLQEQIGTLPPGLPGATWRNGAGVPSNSLGVNNDYYLNDSNSDYYKKISGTYVLQGNLRGLPGVGTNGLNADMIRQSLSSHDISTGFKTFNFNISSSNLGWTEGMRLRFTPTAPGNVGINYMEGYISSVLPGSVVVVIDYTKGSGNFSSWKIGVTGDVGITQDLQKTVNLTVLTNYTLSSNDNNYVILINNGTNNVTITVPSNLPNLFSCIIISDGEGEISFIESGTTIDFLPGTGLKLLDTNAWAILQKVSGEQRFKLGGQIKA